MSGSALRDTGHAQLQLSLGAAGEFWSTNARRFIEALEPGALFTADSLRAAVGDPTRNNAVGMLIRRAAYDGLLIEAGYAPSERTERRHGVCKTWRRA